MTIHKLKCLPEPFQAVVDNRKRFEYRNADRGYKLHDTLVLREWDGSTNYTGRECVVKVNYMLTGPEFGIANGFCVMSITKKRASARKGDTHDP